MHDFVYVGGSELDTVLPNRAIAPPLLLLYIPGHGKTTTLGPITHILVIRVLH